MLLMVEAETRKRMTPPSISRTPSSPLRIIPTANVRSRSFAVRHFMAKPLSLRGMVASGVVDAAKNGEPRSRRSVGGALPHAFSAADGSGRCSEDRRSGGDARCAGMCRARPGSPSLGVMAPDRETRSRSGRHAGSSPLGRSGSRHEPLASGGQGAGIADWSSDGMRARLGHDAIRAWVARLRSAVPRTVGG